MKNIVCISGTSRPGNFTSHALAVVIDELHKQNETTHLFDARDMTLSFPGSEPTADSERLQEAVKTATGVIIASPEYHGGICAMTKLVIENMGFPSAMVGKPVALLGVAAGRIGAIKSLEMLRSICSHVGCMVLPGPVSVAGVNRVFDEDGSVLDSAVEKSVRGVATGLIDYLHQHGAPAG